MPKSPAINKAYITGIIVRVTVQDWCFYTVWFSRYGCEGGSIMFSAPLEAVSVTTLRCAAAKYCSSLTV